MDDDYCAENYKDGPDQTEAKNCENVVRAQKGGTAKKLVLDEDAGFWSRVKDHVVSTMRHANLEAASATR